MTVVPDELAITCQKAQGAWHGQGGVPRLGAP